MAPHADLQILDEQAQRHVLQAIGKSLPNYMAGIRCWAAFCDATSIRPHFPARETGVLRFCSVFANPDTFRTYYLRWAHRFLRMTNSWDTPVVQQVRRG